MGLHEPGRSSGEAGCSAEETFVSNRVRHAIRSHIISWVRADGTYAAKKAGGIFLTRARTLPMDTASVPRA